MLSLVTIGDIKTITMNIPIFILETLFLGSLFGQAESSVIRRDTGLYKLVGTYVGLADEWDVRFGPGN